MSVDIWPSISPEELKIKREESLLVKMLIDPKTGRKKREIEWILEETREVMKDVKHGLEDCYALLAPIDPGSTLVMSTPRNEKVKGHITRVGTRIVKGTLHLQLRTLPTQTITLDPAHPIHIAALDTIHMHLTECIDLLGLTLSYPLNAGLVAAQLRILASSLSESHSLLRGPPLTEPDPKWATDSCGLAHFSPQLGSNISFHLGLQESSLILWLRSLEPVGAPVHLGTKLALALGTVRRLEHDEMDKVFGYTCNRAQENEQEVSEVFVREKVRVESADPSLMSLSAKLNALSHTLAQARRNLAAVMGEELED